MKKIIVSKKYLSPGDKKKVVNSKAYKQMVKTLKQRGLVKTQKAYRIPKAICIIGIGITLFMLTNSILAKNQNSKPATNDNFPHSEIIQDDNGNDIEFSEDGHIIVDPISKEDKLILTNSLQNKILEDALSRQDEAIPKIDEILSINQLPCNMNEVDNEFDKYMISILFKANDKIYNMTYLSGEEFNSEETSTKEFLGDFIIYLGNCAIDTCSTMQTEQQDIIDSIDSPKVKYVGEYFYSYKESGDELYSIPVYYEKDGKINVKLYNSLALNLDAYELEPMQALLLQLTKEGKQIFEIQDLKDPETLNKSLNIYNDFKNDKAVDNKNITVKANDTIKLKKNTKKHDNSYVNHYTIRE